MRLGDEIVEVEEEGEREWIGEEVVFGLELLEERRVKRRKVLVDEMMILSFVFEVLFVVLLEVEVGS